MSKSLLPLAALALILAAAPLAQAAEPGAPDRLVTAEEAYKIKMHQALAAAIDGGAGASRASQDERAAVKEFYERRDGKPFWTEGAKLSPAAVSAIAAIGKAGDYALRASDYPVPAATLGSGTTPPAPAELAEAEVKLSLAALGYAHDAHVGKVLPEEVGNNIDRGSTPPSPLKVLEGLAKAGDTGKYLIGFNPQHPQFELLRRKYLELTGGQAVAVVADAPEEPVDASAPTVRIPPRPAPASRRPAPADRPAAPAPGQPAARRCRARRQHVL